MDYVYFFILKELNICNDGHTLVSLVSLVSFYKITISKTLEAAAVKPTLYVFVTSLLVFMH